MRATNRCTRPSYRPLTHALLCLPTATKLALAQTSGVGLDGVGVRWGLTRLFGELQTAEIVDAKQRPSARAVAQEPPNASESASSGPGASWSGLDGGRPVAPVETQNTPVGRAFLSPRTHPLPPWRSRAPCVTTTKTKSNPIWCALLALWPSPAALRLSWRSLFALATPLLSLAPQCSCSCSFSFSFSCCSSSIGSVIFAPARVARPLDQY